MTANKKRINRPAGASRDAANRARGVADEVAALAPGERLDLIAKLDAATIEHAPTDEAAGSDLLRLLNAIGAEFVRRYYPDATSATFHVHKHPSGKWPAEYGVVLPMAVATTTEAK